MKDKIILLSIFFIVLSSCVSKKDILYLQFDQIDQAKVSNDYQLTFKPDDLVQIIVASEDLVASQPFNLPIVASSPTAIQAMGQSKLMSYLIDASGEIEFPVLGNLKLGGLTRVEAIKLIKEKLTPEYLKSPVINILITNFKITVIGDVKRPQVFNIENERITIFDAIGLAGDLNITGNRKNITVIREEKNIKKIYTVDLTSNKLVTSPIYYLQQNDVIYVKQNNAKVQDASYTRNTGLFISLGSVIISLITILTR
ncbi:polysaccharide export outer membrane protein [Polaribacter sp. Hel1_33_96]|jgi:polysaccharide export outer membrane protein|uniref:polysaccharide biosynthesis/export family protein n=1 Tax=Polaribacter sp. Hel1_33_96 TaxID=1336805 RepID=UPI000C712B53|nr:polysaccharide biosynthesis/export family protein [Polaribacter sp. Hel1_33_96]PKV65410.1 polysaccharide export outer membrane protein [Polaribacter sp. Hel1_33_96]